MDIQELRRLAEAAREKDHTAPWTKWVGNPEVLAGHVVTNSHGEFSIKGGTGGKVAEIADGWDDEDCKEDDGRQPRSERLAAYKAPPRTPRT